MNLTELEPGSRFDGHYVIESVAGRGAMGVVYRAYDEQLDRYVALKVAALRLADLPHLQDGLRREARLAARVEHPCVVAVHHVGSVDGRPYVALQWIEGVDLRTRLTLGALPVKDALRILEQLASGLDAAHAAGCLHRDIKPANVLVRDHGEGLRAWLTDFGVAGALQDAGSHAGPGAATELVGTPAYLAPELAHGAAGDERSDLYGLACVAFELLTATPPFTAASIPAILVAHAVQPRPLASKRRPGLPSAVDGVLAHGMATDPAQRPCSGAELVAELHEALGLTAGGTRAPGPRATARRLRARLDARPRMRRAVTAGAVGLVALLSAGVAAGAHELLTTSPVSNEAALIAGPVGNDPPNPWASIVDKDLPIGPEARAEVVALFEDFAALNRAKNFAELLFPVGGHVHIYGRHFRCRRDDTSLPPGLVLPSDDDRTAPQRENRVLEPSSSQSLTEDVLSFGGSVSPTPVQFDRQRAFMTWAWRTRRAPIRFERLTPAALRPLNVANRIPALQWRGTYIDDAGRRRRMRLVASHPGQRFPWKISHYDYCPGTPTGAKITLGATPSRRTPSVAITARGRARG